MPHGISHEEIVIVPLKVVVFCEWCVSVVDHDDNRLSSLELSIFNRSLLVEDVHLVVVKN